MKFERADRAPSSAKEEEFEAACLGEDTGDRGGDAGELESARGTYGGN